MITLAVYWIKTKYKGEDHDGYLYWGTVIVDIAILIAIS